MKTATVRELRNEFPRIEAWVREGESIVISKRGRIIGTLITARTGNPAGPAAAKPDIMARLRKTWGNQVLSLGEVAAMRADERSNDLG